LRERGAATLIEAAEQAGFALAVSIREGTGEEETTKGAAVRARQAFFEKSEREFIVQMAALSRGNDPDSKMWLRILRNVALPLFDAAVLPGLPGLHETRREKAVLARKSLIGAFSGHGGLSKKIFAALELERPAKPRKTKEDA